MATSSVIGDVSESLVQVLWEHFHQDRQFRSIDQIRIESPEDMQVTNIPQISLFLYRISEDPYLKNAGASDFPGREPGATPLSVTLHYLLTAYARERGVEHRILGEVLQLFHDHPVLEGPALRGGLERSAERFRVLLESPGTGELVRIWEALAKPMRLSACYQVRPVRMEASRGWEVPPTLEREVETGGPAEDLDRLPRR